MSQLDAIIADVARTIPPARLEVEPPGTRFGEADPPQWLVLVRPRSEEDVMRVVKVAARHRRPVVIGGGTSSGRPLPRLGGAIQLDMTGLDKVIELDVRSQIVRVQAGISVAVLRSRLAERRLQLGWTLYNDAPHTLGGVLSGVPVRWGARYGRPFDALRGLTFVTAHGELVREPVSPRRATGPDLASLSLGTQGRLGVILEAALRVVPWPSSSVAVEAATSFDRLAQLHGLLRAGHLPHLLEVTAERGGPPKVVASLHGRSAEVSRAVAALALATGESPRELMSPPVPPTSTGESTTMTWRAFDAFCRALERTSRRSPLLVDQMTLHSVRAVGGSPAAHRAAREAMPSCAQPQPNPARMHLEALKVQLDPQSTLGA